MSGSNGIDKAKQAGAFGLIVGLATCARRASELADNNREWDLHAQTRVSYGGALLRALGKTCWAMSTTSDERGGVTLCASENLLGEVRQLQSRADVWWGLLHGVSCFLCSCQLHASSPTRSVSNKGTCLDESV